MSQWFGEPWPDEHLRAPVCMNDLDRVATPVGQECCWCHEAIQDGDRGILVPWVSPEDYVAGGRHTYAPIHVECSVRQVVGPVQFLTGRCTHAGGTEDCHLPGQTLREDALATWAWVQAHGL